MNNEPWFNIDSASARLREAAEAAKPTAFGKTEARLRLEPQQADYDDCSDAERIRLGNNRKKTKGLKVKSLRKLAKKSKQRNRK